MGHILQQSASFIFAQYLSRKRRIENDCSSDVKDFDRKVLKNDRILHRFNIPMRMILQRIVKIKENVKISRAGFYKNLLEKEKGE